MVYPPDTFSGNSPMSPLPHMIIINLSEIKSLRQFTEVFFLTSKTSVN